MRRLFCLLGLIAIAMVAFAQTQERSLVIAPREEIPGEARHALVIGNAAYVNGPLRNPVNDARAMAKTLGEAGFRVQLLEDASQASMQRAVRAFGNQIAKGGIGLFYYAGHGLQVRGRNYLVPVNADIAAEDEIEFNAFDVNQVLAKMDTAKNALNIVILDACRNNPFQRSFRSMQSGLAQMDAPTGTFIAFATAPGSIAADGTGENGVYTKHLVAEMVRPGVPIEQLFKHVRNAVMAETKGQQIPWESSSLRGDFAFRPGKPQPSVDDAVAEALKRERAAHAEALKREREAQRLEIEKLLQAALDRQREQLAAAGLRPPPAPKPAPLDPATVELAFWESVKASSEAGDYRAYLEQYPNGKFASLAKNRLAALSKKPAAVAALTPVAPATPPAAATRAPGVPQQGDNWTYTLTEPGGVPRKYQVKVAASTPSAILEQYSIDNGAAGEWAHSPGNYIVALGKSLFAPYLASFGGIDKPMSLGRVDIADRGCSGNYVCNATARVVGRESVQVAAGTFEAIKVQIDHYWSAAFVSGSHSTNMNGGRTLTVWYAPAVKRAVKFSSRPTFGAWGPVDTHFDLELVSYNVQ